MNKNILHAIFFDKEHHWDSLVRIHKKRIRSVVLSEVDKFHYCGDVRKGFRLFVCEGCHDVKHVPIRCKGKFCPTCAVGESQRWSDMIADDMYHTIHRHIVFTIDEGLRDLFLLHREELLKGLMDEAANVVKAYFRKKRITPGIIAGLHTFGSQLEFNSHVHMIVTMGGLTDGGKWVDYDYIPYKLLRIHWQNAVLKLLRRTLTPKEKKKAQPLLQNAYSKNAEGFYVNAPKRSRTNVKALLQYISRYMKRGPIALERIIYYDGGTVLFRYHDKRTNKEAIKIMGAKEFILSLIRHIPDKGFKTIRHYGLYSRRIKKTVQKVVRHLQEKMTKLLIRARKMAQPKKWRERITETFGIDPLKCSKCGNYYEFKGIVVSKKGQLTIQYANDWDARRYLREEIERIESEKEKHQQRKAEAQALENLRFDWEGLRQRAQGQERELYLSSMQGSGRDST